MTRTAMYSAIRAALSVWGRDIGVICDTAALEWYESRFRAGLFA